MKKAKSTTLKRTWWAELLAEREEAVEALNHAAARGEAVSSDIECQVQTIRDVLGIDASLKELWEKIDARIRLEAEEHELADDEFDDDIVEGFAEPYEFADVQHNCGQHGMFALGFVLAASAWLFLGLHFAGVL